MTEYERSQKPHRDDLGYDFTDPANWWRTALIGLGVVALILLVMQMMGSNDLPSAPPMSTISSPAY